MLSVSYLNKYGSRFICSSHIFVNHRRVDSKFYTIVVFNFMFVNFLIIVYTFLDVDNGLFINILVTFLHSWLMCFRKDACSKLVQQRSMFYVKKGIEDELIKCLKEFYN